MDIHFCSVQFLRSLVDFEDISNFSLAGAEFGGCCLAKVFLLSLSLSLSFKNVLWRKFWDGRLVIFEIFSMSFSSIGRL